MRIAVDACGVCHSDVLTKRAAFPGISYPRVPGHEIVGRIDALGPGVEGWTAGAARRRRLARRLLRRCDPCRRGDFFACQTGQITGITLDGGYARVLIAPATSLARVPDGLSAAEAAPLLCAGVTTFNALRNSGARSGDLVAVQGLGGLGHLGVQFAAQHGLPDRRDRARRRQGGRSPASSAPTTTSTATARIPPRRLRRSAARASSSRP